MNQLNLCIVLHLDPPLTEDKGLFVLRSQRWLNLIQHTRFYHRNSDVIFAGMGRLLLLLLNNNVSILGWVTVLLIFRLGGLVNFLSFGFCGVIDSKYLLHNVL
jgi:hypothetical protein